MRWMDGKTELQRLLIWAIYLAIREYDRQPKIFLLASVLKVGRRADNAEAFALEMNARSLSH
jgi:hypothetical protein